MIHLKKNKLKLIIWLLTITLLFILYRTNNELFSLSFLQEFTGNYKIIAVLIYILVLSVLGLFFIPSTPFVLAGIVLFPSIEVYIYSLIGILTSSAIVYYFAKFLNLDESFQTKYPKKIIKLKKALSKVEFPIIFGWSILPMVPTDLIIYTSSILKISFKKCLSGVLLGEGILNLIYIFSLQKFLEF